MRSRTARPAARYFGSQSPPHRCPDLGRPATKGRMAPILPPLRPPPRRLSGRLPGRAVARVAPRHPESAVRNRQPSRGTPRSDRRVRIGAAVERTAAHLTRRPAAALPAHLPQQSLAVHSNQRADGRPYLAPISPPGLNRAWQGMCQCCDDPVTLSCCRPGWSAPASTATAVRRRRLYGVGGVPAR